MTSELNSYPPTAGGYEPTGYPPAGYYGTGYQPAPVSPRPPMTVGQSLRAFFQNYARFDGRAGMAEFWWPRLFVTLAWLLLFAIAVPLTLVTTNESTTQTPPTLIIAGILGLLLILGTTIPLLSSTARRLHDAGFSAWFLLLGETIQLILCCMPSKPEGARFDSPDGSQPATGGAQR